MKYLLYFWNEKIWVHSYLLGHLFIKYKTIFSISERWYLFTFGITSSKWGFFLTNSGVANGKDRLGLEFFLEWLLPDDKLEAVLVEDLFNVVSSVKPIFILWIWWIKITFPIVVQQTLDDVLWIFFSGQLMNEALRSPNHKTCFSFSLEGP